MSATAIRLLAGAGILAAAGGWALVQSGEAAAPVAACDTPTTPFCSSTVPFPAGWTGNRFKLAQNFPAKAPVDAQPWLAVDPKADPGAYAKAVLGYFYDGNIRASVENSFNPALNTKRGWYNAPWQDVGQNGREPIHGLTRERVTGPGEIDPAQTQPWNNYAVGFYNAPGGAMFAKMWANHGKPDLSQAIAAEGTVAAKLLFTTAPATVVPWLKGSPEWNAYVWSDVNDYTPSPTAKRAVIKVRLLQLDIAVKDRRAGATGWFFGTFVYNGGPTGKGGSGWENVEPVGLMWGNDPGYSGTGPLKESWINPAVKMPHVGYQGRLNGPVDNPKSSCMSCHAVAEGPESLDTLVGNLVPPKGADVARWFQNTPTGTPFTPGKTSFDYSMQVAFGIVGFNAMRTANAEPNLAKRMILRSAVVKAAGQPSRGGSEER